MIQLEKKFLETFFYALKGTEGLLTLKEGRIRDTFMRTLGTEHDTFVKDRNKIYLQYCIKKEDGTPDIVEGKYQFKPEQLEEINKELIDLADETISLEIPEGLKEIVERTAYMPKVGETEIIDTIISKL